MSLIHLAANPSTASTPHNAPPHTLTYRCLYWTLTAVSKTLQSSSWLLRLLHRCNNTPSALQQKRQITDANARTKGTRMAENEEKQSVALRWALGEWTIYDLLQCIRQRWLIVFERVTPDPNNNVNQSMIDWEQAVQKLSIFLEESLPWK